MPAGLAAIGNIKGGRPVLAGSVNDMTRTAPPFFSETLSL